MRMRRSIDFEAGVTEFIATRCFWPQENDLEIVQYASRVKHRVAYLDPS